MTVDPEDFGGMLGDLLETAGGDAPTVAPAPVVVVPEPPPLPAPGGDNPYPAGAEMAPAAYSGAFDPNNPYAVPDLRNDAGGRGMESAIGMVANLLGVGSGSAEVGTAGGVYRDDWERRNPYSKFDDTVIDYAGSGIDTSAMERGGLPVQRVLSITGEQLGAEPVSRWGDLRSIPGRVPMRDDKGEPLLDEQGRTRRFDLPGWNGQQRFEAGLNPTRLENGNEVLYDRFNNLTYGVGPDGRPDRLLAGGAGYQGGASGGAYGYIPTTRNGRDVWWEGEQGNRTFERRGDRVGPQLGWMDSGRGGQGGGGNVPPVPPGGAGSVLRTYSDGDTKEMWVQEKTPNGDVVINRYVDKGNGPVLANTYSWAEGTKGITNRDNQKANQEHLGVVSQDDRRLREGEQFAGDYRSSEGLPPAGNIGQRGVPPNGKLGVPSETVPASNNSGGRTYYKEPGNVYEGASNVGTAVSIGGGFFVDVAGNLLDSAGNVIRAATDAELAAAGFAGRGASRQAGQAVQSAGNVARGVGDAARGFASGVTGRR